MTTTTTIPSTSITTGNGTSSLTAATTAATGFQPYRPEHNKTPGPQSGSTPGVSPAAAAEAMQLSSLQASYGNYAAAAAAAAAGYPPGLFGALQNPYGYDGYK